MSQDPVSLLRLFEDGESATNITDGMLNGVCTAGVNLYSIFFPGLWSSLIEAKVSEKLNKGRWSTFSSAETKLTGGTGFNHCSICFSVNYEIEKKILKPFPLRVHHLWDSRFSRYVLATTLVNENKRSLIYILPFFFKLSTSICT